MKIWVTTFYARPKSPRIIFYTTFPDIFFSMNAFPHWASFLFSVGHGWVCDRTRVAGWPTTGQTHGWVTDLPDPRFDASILKVLLSLNVSFLIPITEFDLLEWMRMHLRFLSPIYGRSIDIAPITAAILMIKQTKLRCDSSYYSHDGST